ncbi:hypothetical protein JOQ06_004343, partial [Pogonophryne albipinna]
LQNRFNPARRRRHADTHRHADTAAASLPQRGFDQNEAFMGNDWRMHPLLSLQIYLTERRGGGEEGGYWGGSRGGGGMKSPPHAGRHLLKAALDSLFLHLLVRS